MKAAPDQRPSRANLARQAEAVALVEQGMSQHEVARRFDVTQTTIWRWCQRNGVKPVQPSLEDAHELSVRGAAKIAGAPKDAILAHVVARRLPARWGRREQNFGRSGPAEQWVIRRTD